MEGACFSTVGIVGSGRMAVQIAAYLVEFEYAIIVKTGNASRNVSVIDGIKKILEKRGNVEGCLDRIHLTSNFGDLRPCDLIIETSKEDVICKKEIFSQLSRVCDTDVIFATNTSSIPISELGEKVQDVSRIIGCHFFNPVSKMKLVELIITESTSDSVLKKMISFVKSIEKTPICVNNSPGFVVNRLLLPQINDAVRLMDNHVASKEDIDIAIQLGLNHPMGPFALADLIGLDVCFQILSEMYVQTGNVSYLPADSLKSLVEQGKLGRKTQEGFYKY